ncbi:MAG: alpha-L-fucosidase, partial [Clostridia bacterium]|nr:alpha-L-fucosidase [Clostridia bacterium]
MAIPVPEKRIADFENMGFGMFIHFGMYSQLGRGEWIMNIADMPVKEYSKLKDTFTAKDFDGRKIAKIAKAAGMKYIT